MKNVISSLLHVTVLKILTSVCDDGTKCSLGKFSDGTKVGRRDGGTENGSQPAKFME